MSLCSHTPGAQNSTKHFPNAVRVFRLIWGGKVSILIRSCFWQCCSSKLYRTCSFWSWWPTSFFCLLRMYLLTTAFTIQTKNTQGAGETPYQPWITLALRLNHTHTHTRFYELRLVGKWKEYLYISITQNIHFIRQVNTFIPGVKGKKKKHIFLRRRRPPVSRLVVTELGWMWWGLARVAPV